MFLRRNFLPEDISELTIGWDYSIRSAMAFVPFQRFPFYKEAWKP